MQKVNDSKFGHVVENTEPDWLTAERDLGNNHVVTSLEHGAKQDTTRLLTLWSQTCTVSCSDLSHIWSPTTVLLFGGTGARLAFIFCVLITFDELDLL